MTIRVHVGDCRAILGDLAPESVDSCVTDPPYHLVSIVKRFGKPGSAPLNNRDAKEGRWGPYHRASRGFMGQTWDGGGVAFDPETWAAVARVLKPGGHLIAFGGTRTYHRLACAIEDAGFEIRDQLAWVYGSGFPKSHDVAQGVEKLLTTGRARRPDRDLGGLPRNRFSGSVEGRLIADTGGDVPLTTPEAQAWQGWGTALKPAWEPICLARKPMESTVARNVLKHGTGALNIGGCRIEAGADTLGRWPGNLAHDGSAEVVAGFPETNGGGGTSERETGRAMNPQGEGMRGETSPGARMAFVDSGSAARFFYCAKATAGERGDGNPHPTVKPVALMQWLIRMVTPPGGTVLDPFAGSGSTLIAADGALMDAVGCELSPEYAALAVERIRASAGLFADVVTA